METTYVWSDQLRRLTYLFYSSYVQYTLLLYCICSVILPVPPLLSDITHVYVPLIPTHQLSLLCVQNESGQSALKYSSSVLFTYFSMQQTPKAPFSIWLYLLRHHLKITSASFHSLVCLSVSPHGARGDLVRMESSQLSVSFRGEVDIETILQWFPMWYLSVWVFLLLQNNTVLTRC